MIGSVVVSPFLAITVAEVIDIVCVAILLYVAMVWAQRTRAAFVVRGILILSGVYMMARYLDLQMIAWIFQAFFAIFLVVIVVIFQEELRQMFERVALWSLGRHTRFGPPSDTTDILVRTIADLVRDKIGALIVIRGKDPLERHITGGILLDGKLSVPLLRSIFESHSPGHDGAVLIDKDRLLRFAAHLPLSKDLSQLANVGTRHSAALGLAELCEALCVVVSEERGTVSVARNSKLRKLNELQELSVVVQDFFSEEFPPAERQKASWQLVRKNWLAKTAATALAIGLWYLFVPGAKIVEVAYRVPVKIENLPSTLQIEALDPPEVTATFVGPRRSFYLLDAKQIQVSVDVSLAELGRRSFKLSEQNIRFPKELALSNLNPATVKLSVKKVPMPRNDITPSDAKG
jgi:uncharacterized protein (TIGR00159 family)